MTMQFFDLDKNGWARKTDSEDNIRFTKWKEAHLEAVFALNPELIGVQDLVPISLDSGSTCISPDQLYVDELCRATVVEIKSVRATLKHLAQLLSHGDHLREGPPGEIVCSARRTLGEGRAVAQFEAAHAKLYEGNAKAHEQAAHAALDRLNPAWARADSPSLGLLLRKLRLGPMPGWRCRQPRMVLAAPDFDDDLVEFCRHLVERRVNIELVRAGLSLDGDCVRLGLETVVGRTCFERAWSIARKMAKMPTFAADFEVNGWAENLNEDAFSFSVRHVPDVKLCLGVNERSKVFVYTTVPDKWYTDDDPKRRKALRAKLWAAFPTPPDKGEARWPTWAFTVPQDERKMLELIAGLGEALVTVVAPESPHPFEV